MISKTHTFKSFMFHLSLWTLIAGASTSAQAYEFKIESLTLNNATRIEHNFVTGDDRGGIAYANGYVYYTGDGSTGRFSAANLNNNSGLNAVYDGIFSTFNNGALYTLSGQNGYQYYNGGFTGVTTLTGGTPGTTVALSQQISSNYSDYMMFSGYDAAYLWNRGSGNVQRINPLTGAITAAGQVALPNAMYSENWASWGVAEHFGGEDYLTYAIYGTGITRTRISDGFSATLLTANMSDMAAFTVDAASNRWYFHYEGSGQLGGYDESIGYADARITMIPDAAQTALPEPAGIALFGAGLLGLLSLRRRQS